MSATPYVGKILSDQADFKTIVLAKNPEEAKTKVLEKYSEDIGKLFSVDDK